MKTQMNKNTDWLLRMAEEEGNCELSVGGLAHELGILKPSHETLVAARSAFAKLIEFKRRDRGWTVAELAARADVAVEELEAIEGGAEEVPDPRTVLQLANTLKLPRERLMQLAGLAETRDSRFVEAAVRFAARSKPIDHLSDEEHEALAEFVKVLAEK